MMSDGKTSMQRMNIEKRILDLHHYTITPPKNEKDRWQTYVKPEGRKRKVIRDSSYDGLMDKLFNFYFNGVSFDSLTLGHLFEEWIEYKSTITESPNTIRRHEQHWNKYFKEWSSKKLKTFDKLELQKQCNLLIKKNSMSSKEWQNIKTILNGIFGFAYDKGYISINPMKEIKITTKFRQIVKKTGKTETFQTDDFNALLCYFESSYISSKDLVWMSLMLDMYLGLRVGELSALRWCDVIDMKYLHIKCEEIKKSQKTADGWQHMYAVVNHTKTHTDRIIPLVPVAISILKRVRTDNSIINFSGYIFTRDGERLTSRQITYALEKACKDLGISVKRTHKIRKTVASRLNAGGVPLDAIREFLGHSNAETTLGYIYNPLIEEETYNIVAQAL